MLSQVNRLTASRMRDLLKRDQSIHLNNLRENIPLLVQLLNFCLSDYNFDSNAGEFVIRRAYKEMSGVPVLLTCNMGVRAVPMVDTDRICVAPYPLQALLPQLRSSFLHPYILMQHKLFYNALFQDSNFISFFNCQFFSVHVDKILPSGYKNVPVVLRNTDRSADADRLSLRRSRENDLIQTSSIAPITDAVLYALWKYSLMRNVQNLSKFSAWPIILYLEVNECCYQQRCWHLSLLCCLLLHKIQ